MHNSVFKYSGLFPFVSYQYLQGEGVFIVLNKHLLFVLTFLKLHIGFQYTLLSCVSGVDILNSKYRFAVVYDLLSLTYNSRIRVKVFVNEMTAVPSLISIYINSDWWEREVWDMYGILFLGHPDLRRILTDYGFEGHPMRKDFPLSGYVEVRYDETKKRIVLEPVELTQEYRLFSFETPWSN
jgi:NADH/F420H2 dehydrogenase subunit C